MSGGGVQVTVEQFGRFGADLGTDRVDASRVVSVAVRYAAGQRPPLSNKKAESMRVFDVNKPAVTSKSSSFSRCQGIASGTRVHADESRCSDSLSATPARCVDIDSERVGQRQTFCFLKENDRFLNESILCVLLDLYNREAHP